MFTTSTFRAAARISRTSSSSSSSSMRAFSSTARTHLARMSLIGRLAAEPELVATSSGREMVRYAVGVSSGTREQPFTSWFRIASFDEGGKRDYLLALPKGTLLHCDAAASMGQYEDVDGKKKQALNLVQRSIEVIKRGRPQSERAEEEGEGEMAQASG